MSKVGNGSEVGQVDLHLPITHDPNLHPRLPSPAKNFTHICSIHQPRVGSDGAGDGAKNIIHIRPYPTITVSRFTAEFHPFIRGEWVDYPLYLIVIAGRCFLVLVVCGSMLSRSKPKSATDCLMIVHRLVCMSLFFVES